MSVYGSMFGLGNIKSGQVPDDLADVARAGLDLAWSVIDEDEVRVALSESVAGIGGREWYFDREQIAALVEVLQRWLDLPPGEGRTIEYEEVPPGSLDAAPCSIEEWRSTLGGDQ